MHGHCGMYKTCISKILVGLHLQVISFPWGWIARAEIWPKKRPGLNDVILGNSDAVFKTMTSFSPGHFLACISALVIHSPGKRMLYKCKPTRISLMHALATLVMFFVKLLICYWHKLLFWSLIRHLRHDWHAIKTSIWVYLFILWLDLYGLTTVGKVSFRAFWQCKFRGVWTFWPFFICDMFTDISFIQYLLIPCIKLDD